MLGTARRIGAVIGLTALVVAVASAQPGWSPDVLVAQHPSGVLTRDGAPSRHDRRSSASAPTAPAPVDASAPGGATLGLPLPPLPGLGGPDPGGGPPSPTPPPSGNDVTWLAGVGVGDYRALIDVRSSQPTRVDVTVGGEMVATYAVGPSTRTLDALVFIDGPLARLGVRSPTPVHVENARLVRVPPTFTTRGTSILDPTGRVWRFRGVNRPGYQASPDDSPALNRFGHESESMWRWGFNAVRLPLNQEFWLANCEVQASWVHATPQRPDGSRWRYRDLIDEEVRRFTTRGMLVLLDLHVSSHGKATGCDADGSVLLETPDARSAAFWRSVAAQYRDQPYVAFDLYNEPHLDDGTSPPSYEDAKTIWRDGGSVMYRDESWLVPRNLTYQAVGMQELYNEVRATGATNLVFAGGLYYSHRPEVIVERPLDSTGLVASVHMYCRNGCSQVPPPEQTQYIDGKRSNGPDLIGVATRYPTVMTEFGTDKWWDSTDNRSYLRYYESQGLGWAVWTWAGGGSDVSRSPYGILQESTGTTASRTPDAAGIPVWDVLEPIRRARGY